MMRKTIMHGGGEGGGVVMQVQPTSKNTTRSSIHFIINTQTVLNTTLYVVYTLQCSQNLSEAEVLVRKLSQLTPLSYAKRANLRYFIRLFGISCELAGCLHLPIMDSESTIAGVVQTKS